MNASEKLLSRSNRLERGTMICGAFVLRIPPILPALRIPPMLPALRVPPMLPAERKPPMLPARAVEETIMIRVRAGRGDGSFFIVGFLVNGRLRGWLVGGICLVVIVVGPA